MSDGTKTYTLPLKSVKIDDTFWSDYQRLAREVVIPYQWEVLNDRAPGADKSHAVENFRIAAGLSDGEFYGMVFQDSDVAKWLEAVAYSLATHPDPELEANADGLIEIIEKAQQPDGYLNTYFTVKEPEGRWTNLQACHELYCSGHMLEAAVAYAQATGKRKFLDVMCKNIDHISTVLGAEEGKLHGYPGHPEIELALMKLYNETGEKKYMDLCSYFLNERGKQPHFYDVEWEKRGRKNHWTAKQDTKAPSKGASYSQAHIPVREQNEAIGHAVRAVYMYTGMAAFAAKTGDQSMIDACKRLWHNTVYKQMYITGGIGSTNHGEAFTFDYDLPNDLVYAETCASIGLIFFAERMLEMEANSEYADVIETALYNTVLGSMARDGKHFFYVNPLEVWPAASHKNPAKAHVKTVRQAWFGCACCPPNVARLLTSLGQYIYTHTDDTIYCHLYIGGEAAFDLAGGAVSLNQDADYLYGGKASFTVAEASGASFTMALRKPVWCKDFTLTVNGASTEYSVEGGYLKLSRQWQQGDVISIIFDMSIRIMEANPQVRADAGKVALMRGPIVYCLEEADNGVNLPAVTLNVNAPLTHRFDSALLGGTVVIEGSGTRTSEDGWGEQLYRPLAEAGSSVSLKAVPYFLWGNRGEGEMQVWIRKS